jgi:acetyltransferase-like isoleucine patch superfamily enzyme
MVRPGSRLTIEKGGVLDVAEYLDLGYTHSKGRSYPSQLVIRSRGVVRVTDRWTVSTDFKIWVDDDAVLTFGSGGNNYGLQIVCTNSITIGHGSYLGFNVTIRDSDEHTISGGSGPAPVTIGNKVLVATGVTILPGVTIGDGAVVAAGSVVTRDVPSRTLVAGVPARVIREDIDWE